VGFDVGLCVMGLEAVVGLQVVGLDVGFLVVGSVVVGVLVVGSSVDGLFVVVLLVGQPWNWPLCQPPCGGLGSCCWLACHGLSH